MKLVEQLVVLVGHIAWPVALVVVVWIFRSPVSDLIERVRSARWGDGEISFGERLESITEEAAAVGIPPSPEPTTNAGMAFDQKPDERDQIAPVLVTRWKLADTHPSAAVIDAWMDVEAALREAVERRRQTLKFRMSASRMISILQEDGFDPRLLKLVDHLRRLRNDAVHNRDVQISATDARQYVDLAESVRRRLLEEQE